MSQKLPTRAVVSEMLKPPSEEEVADALGQFATDVRRLYGDRLKGIYLFGSRARGDHGPESDADIAIVLASGNWVEWVERRNLVRLAYDASLESGLSIQPWPFSEVEWLEQEVASKAFLSNARREAVPISVRQ